MAKRRDYRAEYQRRIARAKALGYSKSVARGHPRKAKGEIGLARSKQMLIRAGATIERKGRKGTIANPFRPTYAQIRERAKRLGLPLGGATFKGKRGRIPIAWAGEPGDRYLTDDETRDNFIEYYTTWGLTSQEAYTLWFSP